MPLLCVKVASIEKTANQKIFPLEPATKAKNINDIERPCLIALLVDIIIGHVCIAVIYNNIKNTKE